jgi:hypothetical protein
VTFRSCLNHALGSLSLGIGCHLKSVLIKYVDGVLRAFTPTLRRLRNSRYRASRDLRNNERPPTNRYP